jgi:hypothetical protein
VKKYRLALGFSVLSFLALFSSCKKINEATDLGGDLIPAVDNINTFEANLETKSNNAPFNDTSELGFSDQAALGSLNDPEFGTTKAEIYFNLSASSYGTYPFATSSPTNPDSLQIDSVVLSLAYTGAYGDTNSQHKVHVFEIDQNAGFVDTSLYQFSHPDFATTGSELGSKTYTINTLNDSFAVGFKADTPKIANVLRIPLNKSLGSRFATYNTSTAADGGFGSDSIFKSLFRGLALKVDNLGGNGGLSYFNLTDTSTKLTVFFRSRKSTGLWDTARFDFRHATNGQANIIRRSPSGTYNTYLTNGPSPDDKIYLQSSPGGSYASIYIPGLDTFGNKVIHRAELIVTKIPSAIPVSDLTFTPPTRLMLDRINKTRDTAFILQNDLTPGLDGSISFSVFGGTLRVDNTYRINITRHVQGIITRHEPNDTLRLYAPLRTTVWASNLAPSQNPIAIPVLNRIADGRAVFAGGSYPDPNVRLRLRIIYSNL